MGHAYEYTRSASKSEPTRLRICAVGRVYIATIQLKYKGFFALWHLGDVGRVDALSASTTPDVSHLQEARRVGAVGPMRSARIGVRWRGASLADLLRIGTNRLGSAEMSRVGS